MTSGGSGESSPTRCGVREGQWSRGVGDPTRYLCVSGLCEMKESDSFVCSVPFVCSLGIKDYGRLS